MDPTLVTLLVGGAIDITNAILRQRDLAQLTAEERDQFLRELIARSEQIAREGTEAWNNAHAAEPSPRYR